MPINASTYWRCATAALNTESFATKPPVSGTPACASRNNVNNPASNGCAARARGRSVSVCSSSPWPATTMTHANAPIVITAYVST